ncbi:MAG: hypothetical protein P0Y55_07620 [Candidatus Cohnella colombiensis]|uniref:Uncharacterized protein n=1 Tax=Candidatus Cohnella colombiensis TaxID=3121368 RepID=A0AA95EZL5_9BACL|nr:MAG: hypothetical protein P0Y55_07620 [Cohnella sp.]
MSQNQKAIHTKARQMVGQPVYVELMDGSYYIGYISQVDKREFVLTGTKGKGNMKRRQTTRVKKAKVSGLLPGLFSMLGNGGALSAMSSASPFAGNPAAAASGNASGFMGGLGGFGGMFDMVRRSWPMIRMGYGVVRQIMPLFGGLK